MNQYKVYQVEHDKRDPNGPGYLRPVLTLTASSAAEALRIAKQKGVAFPIIGASNDK